MNVNPEKTVYKGLLSIVIPVFNERKTLKHLLEMVIRVPIRKEIILVDDRSTDGTIDILKDIEKNWRELFPSGHTEALKVFYHERNMGKGATLRDAIKHVTGDIVITQDADLEYDPNDYFRLIDPIVNDGSDAVYGSRFVGADKRRIHLFWNHLGNQVLTFFSNMLNNLNLTDMETGYKAFRAEVLKKIKISSNRFGVEPELTAKIARMKCHIYEVPITYRGRGYEEGKKITWRDGLAALWFIVKYRFWD